MDLKEFKLAHLPTDRICRSCGKNRGDDLAKWTLIEGYLCCKWCFQRDVGDKDEQQRLVSLFKERLAGTTTTIKTQAEMIREIWEMMTLGRQQSYIEKRLTTQFTQFDNREACKQFVLELMHTNEAPQILGRYLIGHELKAKWGNRLDHLLNEMPAAIIKDLNGVLVTPGILTRRNELLARDEQPSWLVRAMAPYTTDPMMYSTYSVVYVKALLENPE